MADKFWAHGTTVTFGSVAIGGLIAVGLPAQSKEEVELTDHGSAGWREFVPGLRDGGNVTLGMRLKPSDVGQAALRANFTADGVTEEVVITLPGDPENSEFQLTFTFDAYVQDIGGEAPFDGAGDYTATLRIDGVVTTNDPSV
jgi:predicted secreted protein